MDIKTKQQEILQRGAQERGQFSPEAGSVPARLYNAWVKRGGDAPKQENFCHFWRVVLIWAPLSLLIEDVLVPFCNTRPMRAIGRGLGKVLAAPFRLINKGWQRLGKDGQKKAAKAFETGLIGLLLLLSAIMVISLLVAGFQTNALMTILVIFGVLAFIGTVSGIGVVLSERAAKRDAERLALEEIKFKKWLRDEITDEEYYERPFKPAPGKVKRFFTGLKELLILAVQVVRVKKWKICPLVEIPKN